MIELSTETFAGIECLHATPAGQQHKPLPTVLVWHGFTTSKEVYANFAVVLAQAGMRVVMPDAQMHGTRYDGDAEHRLRSFWSILHSNIEEVPPLLAALQARGLIDGERIAVAGASQGGMTALGAMVSNPQLKCVACLMGSGYFMSLSRTLFPPLTLDSPQAQQRFTGLLAPLARYDVSQQLEKLAARPLLLWHGDADELVPHAESARLVAALRSAGLDQQLTWVSEPGTSHRITPEALAATAAFFRQHL